MRDEGRGLGLRVVYGVVYLGLAAAAVAAALPELSQLLFALSRDFHFGTPPRPAALLGVGLVAVGLGVVILRWSRGGDAPLWASGLVLLAAALPVLGMWREVPQGRSWAAADKAILDVAHLVQRQMVDRLQSEGEVPRALAPWQNVLGEVTKNRASPVLDRSFARVPYALERIPEPNARPQPLRPGTLLVYVAPEGEAFEIYPVGFSPEGDVAPLADEGGNPVVLRGTFNPEMRQAPAVPSLPTPGSGFGTRPSTGGL